MPEARAASGAGRVVSEHVRGQLCAGRSAGAGQSSGLVSPQSGAGPVRAAAADSGVRRRAAAVGHLRIWVLLRREGWVVNRKPVRRLYRLDGLQLRMRVRRRKPIGLHRGPAPHPSGPRERWSMDFVHDALADGRPFRILTVVDQWSRSSPVLEVASRMSGSAVGEALDRVLEDAPQPRSITVDHGTEFQSRALEDWAYRRGVQFDFIRPGKPIENAFIGSFNGRLQDECLNVHQFASIADAQTKIEAWRLDYNQRRPHGSLGRKLPHLVDSSTVDFPGPRRCPCESRGSPRARSSAS